jgi:iron(II)-dependent oxidoreductase
VHDRLFYDPGARKYTVERFLDDARFRYGGVDSVVLWQAYPNCGIDERNQYDFLRDLPGGLEGLSRAVAAFHRQKVRVLLTLSPWDTGTRPEYATARAEPITNLALATKADGFFGDTMVGPDRDYFSLGEARGHPLAIEPEAGMGESLESLLWAGMSWANWKTYQKAPGVDRYRWDEPRFMTHVEDRNAHSRADMLQYAWFNGAGVLVWENVWGAWNGFTGHDAENLRRMAMIYRALPEFPRSTWEPHAATLQPASVFASRWDLPHSGKVWTLVNRGDHDVFGAELEVEYRGQHFYNLWSGEEIFPVEKLINRLTRHATLSFPIDAHGFAAVIETNEPPLVGSGLALLLPAMRDRARHHLAAEWREWSYLSQRMVLLAETPRKTVLPDEMLRIPAAKDWKFSVRGTEGEALEGEDVQYPWETHPQREHEARRDIAAFYLDRTPVTNRQYKMYLEKYEFQPVDGHNFLRDWPGGKLTRELAEKAVTWVSIEEARAYCRSLGKRLPHEWEWQYAAQGSDGRPYPWGRVWEANRVPNPDLGRTRRPGPDVGSFPTGASPFGALDMIGLIWQWTDEFYDLHTRAAVLKGGSYFQPSGSPWYFPTTNGEADNPASRGHFRVDEHGKYLLIDRSGTIGFRCAADAP